MTLEDYINEHPRYERREVRKLLANAHDVSETAVRSWANGTRRHPCTMNSIEITERITRQKVTRFDLRPDIFGYDQGIRAMNRETLITKKISGLEELINNWDCKDDAETQWAISMLKWCIAREKRALHALQKENSVNQ